MTAKPRPKACTQGDDVLGSRESARGITYGADWFDSEVEFRRLCGDALSEARSESAQEFTHEMSRRANLRGLETPVSEKQMAWLCQLAGWTVPARRKR